MEEAQNTIKFIPDQDRIPDYIVFFLTDTCIGIIQSSGVRKLCPNKKFPDKSSAELTR